jgi:diaminopimelate decarboxylase
MDMFLRPALYHAQHPIYHYSLKQKKRSWTWKREYCFVGHCCESSDIITPNSEWGIWLRWFDTQIERWDLLVIWWCWAYCESMKCSWYNGF